MKKNILIITQKVDADDPILGFFHGWIEEFSKNYEKVIVICLCKGKYKLPSNVEILSLGKEEGVSKIKYIYRFYKYIWCKRNYYGNVFVHMNPEYVVLGGIFWKFFGKIILLWYIHPKSNKYLKIAHFFSDKILSAYQSSFPFLTRKLIATGHGIDINLFKRNLKEEKQSNSILYLGRISPIKNVNLLSGAVKILDQKKIDFTLDLFGDALEKDIDYINEIRKDLEKLRNEQKVSFFSSVPNKNVVAILNKHEVLVNLTSLGSLDKVILEAMACECLVITSNKLLEDILPASFFLAQNEVNLLEEKIKSVLVLSEQQKTEYGRKFRNYVIENHNLENLVKKIKKIYENFD